MVAHFFVGGLGEGDRVGQRLGGEEEDLLLLCVVGHREANVGEEGSREHHDAVARDEFVGRVDLVERELPALAIGLGEGGDRRVGADFADLDRVDGGDGA
jgi:hypothetical protein